MNNQTNDEVFEKINDEFNKIGAPYVYGSLVDMVHFGNIVGIGVTSGGKCDDTTLIQMLSAIICSFTKDLEIDPNVFMGQLIETLEQMGAFSMGEEE